MDSISFFDHSRVIFPKLSFFKLLGSQPPEFSCMAMLPKEFWERKATHLEVAQEKLKLKEAALRKWRWKHILGCENLAFGTSTNGLPYQSPS